MIKIMIRKLVPGICIIIMLSGCHSMPVIPSAEVLKDGKYINADRFGGYFEKFHNKNYNVNYGYGDYKEKMHDISAVEVDGQFRWGLKNDCEFGLMFGMTNLMLLYTGVDLKRSILATKDAYVSYDLSISGSLTFISGDVFLLFTEKIGFLSLTPVAGIGVHKSFGNGDDYYGAGDFIPDMFTPGYAAYISAGMVIDLEFDRFNDQGKSKPWGIGLSFLYKKEITKFGSEAFFPGLIIHFMQ